MLRKDLIPKSPVIQILGKENLESGRFGAVISRAGVGKTQFLVQIALCWLLDGKKTIHISLDEAIDKINIRYKEGYTNLIDSVGYIDPIKANRLWEDIDTGKLGISYSEASFSSDNIRDYLTTLKKENLELPAMMVIDGINFDNDNADLLNELATLTADFSISAWFSIQSHREEPLTAQGFPPQLDKVKERFDKALFLNPQDDKIEIVVLKDGDSENRTFLLDPATMMKS
jgi:hypothetical protein